VKQATIRALSAEPVLVENIQQVIPPSIEKLVYMIVETVNGKAVVTYLNPDRIQSIRVEDMEEKS
jgi:hypothetical protein